MASQGVVVTPYVFSDYSQWERKQTCILNTTHSCVLSKHGQVSNKVISKPLGESDNNMRLLQVSAALSMTRKHYVLFIDTNCSQETIT